MTKRITSVTKQSDLVTKNYLDKRFNQERVYIDGKMDALIKYIEFKIEPFETLKARFDDLESKMYDRLDWIMGTLKRMEEEMIISNQHITDLNKKVDNHENRITILEHHTEPR